MGKKNKEIKNIKPQKMTCTMCGTKFIGYGSMCSTECIETWVKENISDSPNIFHFIDFIRSMTELTK